jgi:phenylalanine-4-hydroxylase
MFAARAIEVAQRSPKPRSRQPRIPSRSPQWTQGEAILPPLYYPAQHEAWRKLIAMQKAQEEGLVCQEYLDAKRRLGIEQDGIPELRELHRRLNALSGWSIVKAAGYVQPRVFFQLLKKKVFPCNDMLRHPTELAYTSEPDMWHDVMGHLPMLVDPVFSEFNYLFGRVGSNVRNDTQFNVLGKIYWFSMEFGVINPQATAQAAGPRSSARLYGAASVAAAQEMALSLSDAVERRPFSVEAVCKMETDVAKVNDVLFEVPSFESLLGQLVDWAKSEHLL